jgi:hypothetical protein
LGNLAGFDSDTFQWFRFRTGFSTAQTTIPLHNPVYVFETTEPLHFTRAAMTRHLTLSRLRNKVTVYRKIQQLLASYAFGCGPSVLLAPTGLLFYLREKSNTGGRTQAVQG